MVFPRPTSSAIRNRWRNDPHHLPNRKELVGLRGHPGARDVQKFILFVNQRKPSGRGQQSIIIKTIQPAGLQCGHSRCKQFNRRVGVNEGLWLAFVFRKKPNRPGPIVVVRDLQDFPHRIPAPDLVLDCKGKTHAISPFRKSRKIPIVRRRTKVHTQV
jgi:hypothetical protein